MRYSQHHAVDGDVLAMRLSRRRIAYNVCRLYRAAAC